MHCYITHLHYIEKYGKHWNTHGTCEMRLHQSVSDFGDVDFVDNSNMWPRQATKCCGAINKTKLSREAAYHDLMIIMTNRA